MFQISTEAAAMIEALRRSTASWVSPKQVAEVLGMSLNTAYQMLCDLHVGGWIHVRDTENGVEVALNGVEHKSSTDDRAGRPFSVEKETSDPSPSGKRTRIEDLPTAADFIGLSMVPWPGPRAPDEVCPVCKSKKLESKMYCLYCDRWGLDPQPEVSAAPVSTTVGSETNRPRYRGPSFDPSFDAKAKAKRKLKHRQRMGLA